MFVLLWCLWASAWALNGPDTRLYDVLGVAPDATSSDIEDAFRRLHPANASDVALQRKAFDVLFDEAQRATYDLYGDGSPPELDHRWDIQHSYNFDDVWQLPEFGGSNVDVFVLESSRPWWVQTYWPGAEASAWVLLWNKVAKATKGIARVGILDCSEHRDICERFLGEPLVAGAVTFVSVHRGAHEVYLGPRTVGAMLAHTLEHLDFRVDVYPWNDASPPPRSDVPWLVMMTSPQCLRCVPRLWEFRKASVLLDPLVRLGTVECDETYEARSLPCSANHPCTPCEEYSDPRRYPHFMWIGKGRGWASRVEYAGPPMGSALSAFATARLPNATLVLVTYEAFVDTVLRPTHNVFVVVASVGQTYHYVELIAAELQKLSLIGAELFHVALLNCDVLNVHRVCITAGFRGYPRLFLYAGASRRDVQRVEYLGDWFAHEIWEWIRKKVT